MLLLVLKKCAEILAYFQHEQGCHDCTSNPSVCLDGSILRQTNEVSCDLGIFCSITRGQRAHPWITEWRFLQQQMICCCFLLHSDNSAELCWGGGRMVPSCLSITELQSSLWERMYTAHLVCETLF